MDLVPCTTAADAARRCADRVAATLAAHAEPVLVLPAGRTPLPLYAELVRRQRAGALDLSRAHLFQLDELVGVGARDPRSFQHLLRTHLVQPGELAEARLHLLDGAAPDPQHEIARHAVRLAACGGGHLAVLGIGTNGHVGFNEPGSRPSEGARCVALAQATREGQGPAFAPDPAPETGITLGIAELAACAALDLLATGSSKAAVLADLVHGEPRAELPASWLRAHPGLRVLADLEARAGLSRTAP